jgi:hypothetical protein
LGGGAPFNAYLQPDENILLAKFKIVFGRLQVKVHFKTIQSHFGVEELLNLAFISSPITKGSKKVMELLN